MLQLLGASSDPNNGNPKITKLKEEIKHLKSRIKAIRETQNTDGQILKTGDNLLDLSKSQRLLYKYHKFVTQSV